MNAVGKSGNPGFANFFEMFGKMEDCRILCVNDDIRVNNLV